MIDLTKPANEIASDLYNIYVKRLEMGIMYIDADNEIMLDAVENAITAIELALQACAIEIYHVACGAYMPNATHKKLTDVLTILKSKR